MQTNTNAYAQHRQRLVHCLVENQAQVTNERYVAQSTFALWSYMMTEKHGLKITELRPCLWIPQALSKKHQQLFAHAHHHEAVSCLEYVREDATTGVIDRQRRFVPSWELDQVELILEKHLLEGRAETQCTVWPGAAISTVPVNPNANSRLAAAYCAA